MRLGFTLVPEQVSWPQLLTIARAVDDNELFTSLWTGDHFYAVGGSDLSQPRFEAWTLLAAVSQATQRVRLGTMVTGLVYRHPAVLANMAATVDAISGGRLDIGIGTGWSREECEAYGIELGTMGEAFDRLDEGLQVVVSLLTNPTTTFDGQYYQLKDAMCEPKLLQSRPHITMGGSGYRRTVPLVARYADHWNFPAMTDEMLERLPEARAVLARECQKIGRDPAEIQVSTMLRVVGDPHGIRPLVERRQKAGVDMLILAPTSHELDDLDIMAHEAEGLIDA